MSRFQDRFCFGIKRESSFSAVGFQQREKDRIPISLQREKTVHTERSVYSLQRDKTAVGERLNLSFPREKAFQVTQQRKPVRFQKLCGWKTPDIEDGVVEWIKIQLQIQGKKDRKLRISTEELVYRHVPKRRCPGIPDAEQFENDSLHSTYFIIEETKKKDVKKQSNSVPNSDDKDTNSSTSEQKRRLLRSGSKDDMEVVIPSKKEKDLDVKPKRSRSVTEVRDNYSKNSVSSSQLKRLLKCAKFYQSRDNDIFDDYDEKDDDEGYGSKTSSADDKFGREFGAWDVRISDFDNEFKSFVSSRRPAKFSYTHQTTKTQLYCDSEDEGIKDVETDRTYDSSNPIKYYRTGYQDNTPDYINKLLETTYSQMGNHRDSNDILKIREIRATRLTLRKISIQDASEGNNQIQNQSNTPFTANNQKDFYDQQKTLVRSNSSLQTDRTQYPVYCTSPELKFNTNAQRPVSKKNIRSIREEHSQRLAQTELLNRTRFPYLDFYRAHSSVNLPLSEILPAVDRSMKNKNSKTKYVYENVPNITSVNGLDREQTKVPPDSNPQTLGGPPFRDTNKTPDTALKRQPSCILDYYQNNSTQWVQNQSTKVEGNNLGIRLSGNPDKDAKKKLRDAFSRFYNTRSSMKNRDWASDFKYIYNT